MCDPRDPSPRRSGEKVPKADEGSPRGNFGRTEDEARNQRSTISNRKEANMTREELLQRISIDPEICFGKPCIRGTRIWIALIIENLATGVAESEILQAYPDLQADDIRAALAYAAEVTRERVIPVSVTAR
jgi:uncharacterized protein (DUF433 family)